MRYSFSGFSLDVDARELRRGADVVSVAPQVFDLIAYLVRHRARVISKDELIDKIWGGRTMSDAALTTRLYVARKAIGDHAGEQRLIKTFPRKGVRFVGLVRAENGCSDASPSKERYETPMTARQFASRPSIVVLPFANLSGDPRLDTLSESIPTDVSTELLKLRDTISIACGGDRVDRVVGGDVHDIGRELGARYVLEGSLRAEGARLRATVRLSDATAGVLIWGQHFGLDRAGITTIHDDTVTSIASGISSAIRSADLQRMRHKRSDELGAWDVYQRGLWHMSKSEAADNKLARSLFQRAVDLDPHFGPGYAAIAFTYTAASSAFSELSIAESCEVAEPLVHRAIALDETDSEARSRLALLALLRGDLEGAAREADQVLSVHEGCPDAWGVKGAALSYAGHRREGREAIRRYFSLNPRDIARPIRLTQIASSLYIDGGYEEAVLTARQVIRRYPQHPFAYRWLAAALGQLGRASEAQDVLQTLQAISPPSFEMYIRQQPPQFCSAEYAPMLEGLSKAGWKE